MHLKQHDDALNDQLNPLVDKINTLVDKLSQLNESSIAEKERTKLQKWRQEAIRIVDSY
jgi:flagellar hook-associated protein FlgK